LAAIRWRSLRFIVGAGRSPRPAARHAFQRFPATACDPVADNHSFRVAAARRSESAPESDPRGSGRQGAPISVDAGERDRLGIPDHGGRKEYPDQTAEKTATHSCEGDSGDEFTILRC